MHGWFALDTVVDPLQVAVEEAVGESGVRPRGPPADVAARAGMAAAGHDELRTGPRLGDPGFGSHVLEVAHGPHLENVVPGTAAERRHPDVLVAALDVEPGPERVIGGVSEPVVIVRC